jgi:hypothetical protein
MREKTNAYRILVENAEGVRRPGGYRHRRVDNNKWILDRMSGIDWIDLAQVMVQWRALVYTVMNVRVS